MKLKLGMSGRWGGGWGVGEGDTQMVKECSHPETGNEILSQLFYQHGKRSQNFVLSYQIQSRKSIFVNA